MLKDLILLIFLLSTFFNSFPTGYQIFNDYSTAKPSFRCYFSVGRFLLLHILTPILSKNDANRNGFNPASAT